MARAPDLAGQPRQVDRGASLRRRAQTAALEEVVRLHQGAVRGTKAVLAYLSRYTHRVAISNTRLISHDERGVTFRYNDYRANGMARRKVMTLAADEFIGVFCSTSCQRAFTASVITACSPIPAAPPILPGCANCWAPRRRQQRTAASFSHDQPAEKLLPPCPCCGGRMIVIEFFERGMQPRYRAPSVAAIWFDTS